MSGEHSEHKEVKERNTKEAHEGLLHQINEHKKEVKTQLEEYKKQLSEKTGEFTEREKKELESRVEKLEAKFNTLDKRTKNLESGYENWNTQEKMVKNFEIIINNNDKLLTSQLDSFKKICETNKELTTLITLAETNQKELGVLLKEINRDSSLKTSRLVDDSSSDDTSSGATDITSDKKTRILTKQHFAIGILITTISSLISGLFSGVITYKISHAHDSNETTLDRLAAYLMSIKDLLKAGEISQDKIWEAFAAETEKSPIMTIEQQINALIMLQLIISDLEIQEDFFWDDLSDMVEKIDVLYAAYEAGETVSAVYSAARELTYNEAEIPVGVVALLLQICLEKAEYKIHHPDETSGLKKKSPAELVAASRSTLAEPSAESNEVAPFWLIENGMIVSGQVVVG